MNGLSRRLVTTLMALLAFTVEPALAQGATAWKAAIQTHLNGIYPKLGLLYEDIHASPELAFQEVKTAGRLASEMRALGFQVTENVGPVTSNSDGLLIVKAGVQAMSVALLGSLASR